LIRRNDRKTRHFPPGMWGVGLLGAWVTHRRKNSGKGNKAREKSATTNTNNCLQTEGHFERNRKKTAIKRIKTPKREINLGESLMGAKKHTRTKKNPWRTVNGTFIYQKRHPNSKTRNGKKRRE